MIEEGGFRRPGRWTEGGLWIRGLCNKCNSRAGSHFDKPYADFAVQMSRFTVLPTLGSAIIHAQAPPVRFAPGLVGRSVLYGMFALNARMRELFPELADDLCDETPGEGPLRWPDRLELRVGRAHPLMPRSALLSAGIWSMRVLQERVVNHSFADVVFPPLVWMLRPARERHEAERLGPSISDALIDASGWVRFGPDRVNVDLRDLCRTLPALAHPALLNQDDWVELMAGDGQEGAPTFLFGRLP